MKPDLVIKPGPELVLKLPRFVVCNGCGVEFEACYEFDHVERSRRTVGTIEYYTNCPECDEWFTVNVYFDISIDVD